MTFLTDWSDKGTIMPEPLLRDYSSAEKLYPEKRKVVHFMQPHVPFLNYDHPEYLRRMNQSQRFKASRIWKAAEKGKVKKEKLIEMYRANVNFAFENIREEFKDSGKKVVITSDHGNLLGEQGYFGHWYDAPVKELRKVPLDILN